MNEDIVSKINALKKEKNAVILVHSYQKAEVQAIGDFVGDSLGLCIQAAETNADVIVFCGVHFMAESAKLLNPSKTVLLPEKNAGCPMADMVTADGLRKLKSENPGAVVVCYVNSTADVKAESDICCTSSNAVKILEAIPKEKSVIFVPDKHLGRYAAEKADREAILWPGFCPTHQRILPEYIKAKKAEYPEALVMVHPECAKETVDIADFVGSTEAIFNKCTESNKKQFIIGTEEGIISRLKKKNPDKEFIPATDLAVCRNMKLTDLNSILRSLENMDYKVEVDDAVAVKAVKSISKMLELS